MTNQESIYILKNMAFLDVERDHEKTEEAIRMAISALETIDHITAAEVASVTHGWWILKIHDEDDDGGYPLYHCSSCDHPRPHKRDNYCPNCGAKMDGEREIR